ncbi:hypothetical protein [Halopelagius fulvigenes]|uniref:Uncharacterized protein n=1 Tax=Halopelagius fulvigenes TaxID=1198324 RepID=A0ABD5U2C5_9EURY
MNSMVNRILAELKKMSMEIFTSGLVTSITTGNPALTLAVIGALIVYLTVTVAVPLFPPFATP